ncbi:protein prenylyltransferase [Piedraia hortae CBS 480.64]|uniref:Geranylgeranyl transferase type-2 subunit alpha n=1 Tax=Piedraia hortae CBS 480.64 TaxID=1314780 RepID=A0A6A7BXJ4_9PEZI|nr:protein prenylyltransferase [Piedraia hortae CBS 480.64]
MVSHGVPRPSAPALPKSSAAQAKERAQIEKYRSLEDSVRQRMRDKDFSHETYTLILALLGMNPEYYTVWNWRRILLGDYFTKEAGKNGVLSEGCTEGQKEISLLINEDLQSTLPLLKQTPKCYWIWNHRLWLLRTATEMLPSQMAAALWETELGLVGKMLSLDNRNFHGWGYRRLAVAELEKLRDTSMTESEWAYTTDMVKRDLSNFSAWHRRSELLPKVISDRGDDKRNEILEKEFEWVTTALWTDPADQSLWFYHSFLLDFVGPDKQEDHHFVKKELDNLREMKDEGEMSKYLFLALLQCCDLQGHVEEDERREWITTLQKIDPLRKGRWDDMQ